MNPLKGFLEIGYAFSGAEDDPSIKVQSKHVLGGMAKYVYS